MSVHISGLSLGGGLGPLLDQRNRSCARSPCNCTASLNKVMARSHTYVCILYMHGGVVHYINPHLEICPLQAQTPMRHSIYINFPIMCWSP